MVPGPGNVLGFGKVVCVRFAAAGIGRGCSWRMWGFDDRRSNRRYCKQRTIGRGRNLENEEEW